VHFTKTSLFYKDLSALPEKERSAVNFDQPEALDTECLQDVLGRLAIRDTLKLPFYDFIIHMRKTETVRFESRPLILIEGNFVSSLSMAR
jgi:uridine kinase